MSSWKRALRPALIAAAATALAAAALISIPSASAATGDGSTTDSNITYVGRWDKSSTAFYRSNWAGSYLRTGFTGTTVKLRQRNTLDLYVSIDGGRFVNYVNVSGVVNVTPTPLRAGNHTLVVAYKQVAGGYRGDAGFGGLVLDSGARTFAIPVRPQLVEWVGDSITAGATSSQLALTDYAWIASEAVGAEHTQIAAGGWCLAELSATTSTRGVACSGHEGRYFLQSGIPGEPAWDFSKYRADAVVINLGTNDRSHGVTDAVFQTKYTALLAGIRAKYPNAALLALRTFSRRYAAVTEAAVNTRRAAGDSNVHYIDTEGWLTADGLTDSVHPNDRGHEAIAARLAPILRTHLARSTAPVTSTPPGPNPSTAYRLVNRNSGKVLAVAGGGAANGAVAVQVTDNGSAAQRWQMVTSGGYTTLVNQASGRSLDVFGRSLLDGAAVVQWTGNGGANQQWTITTSGGYSKLINRSSGKALDVANRSLAEDAPVVQWTDNGGANQQWQIVGG
ncbi:MAG TPA: RICIN domain-containing protein [Micromonosporaceae bacterium]|nr:RICIN domain-containing protein [Micromonosporaceae bacterium]